MMRVVLLFAVLCVAAQTYAATLYVSTTGNDSVPKASNSSSTPWRTLALSVPKLVCGDLLYVRGGTYTETASIPFRLNCGSTTVTISSAKLGPFPGDSMPRIQWSYFVPDGSSIQPLDGFVVAPVSEVPANIVSGLIIQGLEIADVPGEGIKLRNATQVIIRRNEIHHTAYDGIEGGCLNCTVDRNELYDTGDFRSGPNCLGSPYFGTSPLCNQYHGFYINGMGWIISNNLIWDVLGYGLQAHSIAASSSQCTGRTPSTSYCFFGGAILHNTWAYARNRPAIVLWNEATTAQVSVIKNNMFYENSNTYTPNGENNGIKVNQATVSGTVVGNNVGYATVTNSVSNTGFWAGSSTGVTFAANCPNGGAVTTSCTTNPNMVNAPALVPASPDFHLTASSTIAIGQAENVSVTYPTTAVDFEGNTRSVPFDIGAYEFGASDTTAPAPPTGVTIT